MSHGNMKKSQSGAAGGLNAIATTATATGTAVDLAGYQSALVVLDVGVITDGTHTPKLQESDTGTSGWTDVAAGDLEGTFAALASNTNQYVGYKGHKRYIRVVITVSGTTTGGIYGACIIRGQAQQAG